MKTSTKTPLTLSVTQLMHYAQCPYRYRLLYRLGWNAWGEKEREDRVAPGETGMAAQTLGSLVHRVLEMADFAHLESSAQIVLKENFPDLTREQTTEALRLVGNWGKSDLFQEAVEAVSLFREHTFLISLPELILEGSIDLLFISKKKEVTVLDYKTSSTSHSTAAEKSEEYRLQLELYLWAARQLFPQATQIHGGLFFLQEGDFVPIPSIDEKCFSDKLSHLAESIKKLEWKATPSPALCSRCSVRGICSYRAV